MKANWSLVLNLVLLLGVIVAIAHLIRARSKSSNKNIHEATSSPSEISQESDDIISVRKMVDEEEDFLDESLDLRLSPAGASESKFAEKQADSLGIQEENSVKAEPNPASRPIMLFLSPKDEKKFAGYELLQALLAEGLRFGEGSIFHKHQSANGQGTILFSVAAATSTGTFDLQNMGACSFPGLCLYMHLSGNANIDEERFESMLEISNSLAKEMHAMVLDDNQQGFTEVSLARYHKYFTTVEEEPA